MTDMRLLAAMLIGFLLSIGLLTAKAFSFSVAWVLWPIGVIALIFGVIILVMSEWAP